MSSLDKTVGMWHIELGRLFAALKTGITFSIRCAEVALKTGNGFMKSATHPTKIIQDCLMSLRSLISCSYPRCIFNITLDVKLLICKWVTLHQTYGNSHFS